MLWMIAEKNYLKEWEYLIHLTILNPKPVPKQRVTTA